MLFGFSGFSPVSFLALLVGCAIILRGPKHWMLPTFLAATLIVSMLPQMVLLGFAFMTHRTLLTCAWIRILTGGDHRDLKLNAMDKAFIAYCVWTLIGDTLLYIDTPGKALVYQVANSIYDGLGIYFMCRILMKDATEIKRAVVCLAVVSSILAGFMVIEHVTRRNLLSMLGALHSVVQIREGKLRCQATFSVPITAGTFGGILFPLFATLWWQEGRLKRWAVPGCIATMIIIVTASSGGPLMTFAAVMLGFFLWPWRGKMRSIRWIVGITLLVLHFSMKAPVWALIARIHVVPGNSGYHRYFLIDSFIREFREWWMLGIKATAQWGGQADDVANQFCVAAKHGGILSLILFVRVIVVGFREVGLRLKEVTEDRPTQIMLWGFGVMLWAHCVSFLGISYFDQTKIVWFWSLAALGSLHLLTQPQEAPEEVGAGEVEVTGGAVSPDASAPAF
jgi:hypothetical protein